MEFYKKKEILGIQYTHVKYSKERSMNNNIFSGVHYIQFGVSIFKLETQYGSTIIIRSLLKIILRSVSLHTRGKQSNNRKQMVTLLMETTTALAIIWRYKAGNR